MEKINFYNLIYNYCKDSGYIQILEEKLSATKLDLIETKNIKSAGLDILDAIHCLLDKNRTLAFMDEIDTYVKEKDCVLEVGLGTGILAFYAASKGALVTGVEINEDTFQFANSIKDYLVEKGMINKNNIEIIKSDIFQFRTTKKFNVIICENIYTGLFREKQAQIINYVLDFKSDNGIVIPFKIDSYVAIANTSFIEAIKDNEEIVPSGDKEGSVIYRVLTNDTIYDSVNFNEQTKTGVDSTVELVRKEKGGNSILIFSNVVMPSGKILKHDEVNFMNNAIIIAKNADKIPSNDIIKINIKYNYGIETELATFDFI